MRLVSAAINSTKWRLGGSNSSTSAAKLLVAPLNTFRPDESEE